LFDTFQLLTDISENGQTSSLYSSGAVIIGIWHSREGRNEFVYGDG